LATNEEKKMNDFGYHMEPDDVVVRRVCNGWVVFTPEILSEDYKHLNVNVYEDADDDIQGFLSYGKNNAAPGFKKLLWEHWDWLFRSKRMGGMQIEVHDKGYESED
jgi:hypothetical protein